MRLGVDVGGTFTDLVLIDDTHQRVHYTKTLSTPSDLAEGVLAGIEKLLKQAQVRSEEIDYLVHGTTIGTNALIERKGAKVGLITTSGFRDVLEIARIERPDGGLYDMTVDLPEPLVPRYLRLEAIERVAADGSVVHQLDELSVHQALEILRHEQVEAVAVCLLFSFRNPDHEQRIRALAKTKLPGVPVTISSSISPEFREFERTSTCVLNAYLLPITHRYIDSLSEQLRAKHGLIDLRIMQASGGSMTAEAAKSRAVHMVNSGPAGGALATALFGGLAGEEKVIGVDMGGTSFDVSLIVNGEPRLKAEGDFEGYPVKAPMIDVEGIGAGGGSIARVDPGGALNVGPESAGADPGPACYGRGGKLPTVTDANLVLSRLNPDYFLGAEMALHVKPAHAAIRQHVAEPLGLSVDEAAIGMIRVVNANMVRGISANSTQKGFDVREFSLLAFGGAGPLHAVELAQELGMRRVIIPPFCAVFSAFGAVASDVRHDYVRTTALGQAKATAESLEALYREVEAEAKKRLAEEGVAEEVMQLKRSADMRYLGQSYELSIPFNSSEPLTDDGLERLIQDFHAYHQRIYSYSDEREAVEIMALRLAAIGQVPKLNLIVADGADSPTTEAKQRREVFFPGHHFIETDIFERESLITGQSFRGPCLVEERTSTTVIPPGWNGLIDRYRNIIVEPIDALSGRSHTVDAQVKQ